MSRRIVQVAVGFSFENTGKFVQQLYALDNNGIAWRLVETWDAAGTTTSSSWKRLPALPSIENPTPAPLTLTTAQHDLRGEPDFPIGDR